MILSLHMPVYLLRTKTQFSPDEDISKLLDDARKHRIHKIFGYLLYYACAVDNKLLVALSAIAAKQSKATVATEQAVHLLLDYVPHTQMMASSIMLVT